ncbi:MAG: hypothetical protein IKZ03_05530 [Clostridia bacterium]|nr:hypothetical protein [Clostridia bacterium]
MIKGCQKKIIHLKNTDSPYFEEAYFILRTDDSNAFDENDMIREAMKIAESTCAFPKKKKVKKIPSRAFLITVTLSALTLLFSVTIFLVALFA